MKERLIIVLAIRKAGGSNAVFFPTAPEGGLVDTEDFGRLLKRSGRGEDSPDVPFFEFFKRDRVADLGARIGLGEAGRQKLRADPLASAEDDGSLDDVAQLADVAWPGIFLELAERFV